MARWAVIADDLTGACDTGAVYARRGLSVEVFLRPDGTESLESDAEVLSIDTESRHVTADKARERVAAAVRAARASGTRRFYKKVDSTLRGNLGAELRALVRETGCAVLPFVPACPKAGRTTRGGDVFVHGVRVDRTGFARDPRGPVTTASCAEKISTQWDVLTEVIAAPAGGALDLPAVPERPTVWIFDAESDADLDVIAARLQEAGLLDGCAGAAGFAEHVARRMAPRSSPKTGTALAGPLLVVNGSLNDRARAQAEAGRRDGINCLWMPGCEDASGVWQRRSLLANDAIARLAAGEDVLLSSPPVDEGSDQPDSSGMAEALGAVTAGILPGAPESTMLCVFGGDTAAAVLNALGIGRFRVLRELWPGVVESVVRLGDRDRTLITKSGGFGPIDLLPRLRRMPFGREGNP